MCVSLFAEAPIHRIVLTLDLFLGIGQHMKPICSLFLWTRVQRPASLIKRLRLAVGLCRWEISFLSLMIISFIRFGNCAKIGFLLQGFTSLPKGPSSPYKSYTWEWLSFRSSEIFRSIFIFDRHKCKTSYCISTGVWRQWLSW